MSLQTTAFERPSTAFQSKKNLRGLGIVGGRAVAALLRPLAALLADPISPRDYAKPMADAIWRSYQMARKAGETA
jgi:hypothetical protein